MWNFVWNDHHGTRQLTMNHGDTTRYTKVRRDKEKKDLFVKRKGMWTCPTHLSFFLLEWVLFVVKGILILIVKVVTCRSQLLSSPDTHTRRHTYASYSNLLLVYLDHFYQLRAVGRGSFFKVRIVRHKRTGREYALKYTSKDRCIQRKCVGPILCERRLLERLEYPLIVNLRYAFQDDETLYMVLDLMLGGDLRHLLDTSGPLKELQVRFYVAQIALALHYLHLRRIAHR